ncbi:MAG: sodium:solute symporter [Coriobacteriia bacterium]|nr:sodium:solute symporter [Coriobacteriia bacterium]
MNGLDYLIIVVYFIGLILVSVIVSKKIKSSEDMFIAGRNSSWWLSGISSYMTIFSASTFVVWGGVSYKSGIVAVIIAMFVGVASFIVGKWISGKWREMAIKSPGEFLTVRFGKTTLNFYTIIGIVIRAVQSATSIYSVAIIMCALITIPEGPFSFLASTGLPGDSTPGYLSIWWALGILVVISVVYTVLGGFLAVLMTDVVQFGVLLAVVVFMVPLSFNAVGGFDQFMTRAAQIPGFLSGSSNEYNWVWLILWLALNCSIVGGDWPYVQRYISVPTKKDAKKSNYLIFLLYLIVPLIWYVPTMVCRTLEPSLGLNLDATTMSYNGEHAYVNMCSTVLMNGMLGMMVSAMLSATLSTVSGTLNVYANVFTYDIWNHFKKNRNASEKQKIRAGRNFTFVFGVVILGISLLVPFLGGAEKVVVTVLTLVLGALFIPAIWGVFSKRITGNQLMISVVLCWIIGIAAKICVPPEVISSSLVDSIAGVMPIVFLTFFELYQKYTNKTCRGYNAIQKLIDPHADDEPGPETKKATKAYSHMAITVFCITIGVIALLLITLLVVGDAKTLEVSNIVIWYIVSLLAIIGIYIIYRTIDYKRSK